MATVRCEEIANEKFSSFAANEVPCFSVTSMINFICLLQ